MIDSISARPERSGGNGVAARTVADADGDDDGFDTNGADDGTENGSVARGAEPVAPDDVMDGPGGVMEGPANGGAVPPRLAVGGCNATEGGGENGGASPPGVLVADDGGVAAIIGGDDGGDDDE